ncbi:MFS transporter [Streptomyces pimonensis]|uniref:MFS transporter n=1 Tax=Streptomyces pimonensis TaxID=2860288 RepID=A0ABV4J092_9ACTN
MSADLQPSGTQQLWIFDIYAFAVAGPLMTMGPVGDRIGRRRLLPAGAAGFGAASLVAAYAHSAETLLVARPLLGIGGATLMPSALVLVRSLGALRRRPPWALVPSVPIGFTAPFAARPVQKGVNRAHVVTAGFATAVCGYAVLPFVDTDDLVLVLVACGVLAMGVTAVMSQVMDLALGAAPVERAGSASSLMETGSEFGGALGMAFLGSIGTAVYRDGVPDSAPAAAHETLGGALAVAERLPEQAGGTLATAAREAFTQGMNAAAIAGAVVFAGAAVLASVALRRVREEADAENAGRADLVSPSGV